MKTTAEGSERYRQHLFPLLCAAVIGLMIIGAKVALESGFAWRCPSMSIFNVPCPSCGSTRALAALADFNVASALRYNPLFVIGLGAMLLFPLLQRFRWSRRENALWLMFAAAVSLNWAYLFLFLPR